MVKQAVFIRIPKTASTSMVKAMYPYKNVLFNKRDHFLKKETGGSTCLAIKHRESLPDEIWNNSFVFAFVRNPYDRCVSSWKFLKPDLPFKSFVKKVSKFQLDRISTYNRITWHTCLQLPHLVDEKGNLMVDFIGKFENLQNDYGTLCDIIGIEKTQLPHLKKTNRGHYSIYYTDEIREMVYRIYRKDIDYFGYSFEVFSRSFLKRALSTVDAVLSGFSMRGKAS